MVFMGKQLASEEIRGKTVAIIGGGPAGCATATRLVPLSRQQDPGLRVRPCGKKAVGVRVALFEGRDFERHYTRCAGVLPPPIEELLQCRLDVELPYEIFKRQIFGYRLHTWGKEILLVGHHRI